MENEVMNFISVCMIVSVCLSYCYVISSEVPKGFLRLLFFLPIISIFLLLPWIHSTVLFQLYTGIFIAWHANFNLLLIALGQDDPLSTDPSLSLQSFIMVTALPIKIKRFSAKENSMSTNELHSPLVFAINAILWYSVVQIYVNKPYMLLENVMVRRSLYTARMILHEQIVFTLVGWAARALLKCQLEAQFDNPHLATSVQDFWGRRWNLMSSSLLKSTVYLPTRSIFLPIMGRRWAVYPAVITTFTVSGLMHEMFFFYATDQWPTWKVMWFYVINGVWVGIEIELKKRALEKGWNLHNMISWLLTLAFIVGGGTWLSYTELMDSGVDAREIQEYSTLANDVKTYFALAVAMD
ncbi:hypothetical protein ACHQM5_021590 [Ranunculus cassubicifolius]